MNAGAIGVLAAVLLLSGGGVLCFLAFQASRRKGVERLRRVLVEEVDDHEDPSLAATWSALVRAAEQVGSRSGLYAALRDRLTRAGWVLNATEFLFLLAGLAVVGLFAGWRLGGTTMALAVGLGLPIAAYLRLSGKANRYSQRCDDQLPDALGQMGAAMRSGHSLQQALEAVAEHGPQPLAGEFKRVLAATTVGRPLDEALLEMGERVGSLDLRWSVRAMLIQRRTGGKLADILDVLSEFMRDRTEVRREVKALTAEGKVSAIILMALPFVVLAGVLATNASYLNPMVVSPVGRLMLLGAVVAMSVAWLLIRKIIRVEV